MLRISSQETDSIIYVYDTVYAPADTLKNMVEIIEYEYVEVEPLEVKLGISGQLTSSAVHFQNKRSNTLGGEYSFEIECGKRWYFFHSGITYSPLNLQFYRHETNIGTQTASTVYQQPIDTIYRENNGNPQTEVFYKEVRLQRTDTIINDTIIASKHRPVFVSVPLMAGLKFIKGRFAYKCSAGAELAFPVKNSVFEIDNKNVTLNKFTLYYAIAAASECRFTKHLSAELSVNYAYGSISNLLIDREMSVAFKLFYRIL